MNRFLPSGLMLLLSAFLFSCSSKKEKFSIRLVDEIQFRRTFADAQFMDSEEEKNMYYEKQEKSNPILVWSGKEKDTLLKQLQKSGFTKADAVHKAELLVDKFKPVPENDFSLTGTTGNPVTIRIKRSLKEGEWQIHALSGNDSSGTRIDYGMMDLYYTLIDFVPGGYKEIIIVKENYFMLGYNFDIVIYEIES